jgi:hypothetical protein
MTYVKPQAVRFCRLLAVSVAIVGMVATLSSASHADEKDAKPEKKPEVVELAEGKVTMTAPETWVRRQPRVRIIAHEFSVPAAEGETEGRVTVMGAGGGVDANISRWNGQFGAGAKSNREKIKVSGTEVHIVDISGTFMDRARPFDKPTPRENYRMLGAIIVAGDLGQYYVKFYGPRKTVDENEKAFRKMVDGMKVK